MKLSDFEKMVLEALILGDPEERIIREQLASAKVTDRDYTGVGLYTKIVVCKSAPVLRKCNRHIEETPKTYLQHPNLEAGAGALLWFDSGKVSILECYTYDGDWPTDEALFSISS